ncbi:hypothetical protein MFLAVUS_009692 [Mucor flavus]|uniref:Uncharacterized protein n=1 Tax=Mucor flavus TaxID=439312 RepID=A0ABP9ZAR2_9FUNG
MVNNGKGTSSVDITRDSFEATELRYANSFQNDDSILTVDPEETERVPVTYSTLKKAMMKKAEDIHQQYQMNQNVSPGKRKSMSLCNEGPTGTKELQEFKISGIYFSAQVMNCNKGSSVDIQSEIAVSCSPGQHSQITSLFKTQI